MNKTNSEFEELAPTACSAPATKTPDESAALCSCGAKPHGESDRCWWCGKDRRGKRILRIFIDSPNGSLGKSTLQGVLAGFLCKIGHNVMVGDYAHKSTVHRTSPDLLRHYQDREGHDASEVQIIVIDYKTSPDPSDIPLRSLVEWQRLSRGIGIHAV